MPATSRDRITPTAVGLVSRAWVINAVEARVADPAQRLRYIDALSAYEPPRRHGLRNMFLFWTGAITASSVAGMLDLPRWTGFVVALLAFLWVARELATRALLWRLDQLERGADDADAQAGP